MAKEVFMPKLSSTMEIGTLIQWFKEVGDTVEIGEPLFEILTDKINIEVESYEEGILLSKYFAEDDEIPVNTIIAFIGEENEEVPEESPGIMGSKNNDGINLNSEKTSSETVKLKEELEFNVGKVRATPAARRRAKQYKLDLSGVKGTGPKGRIHEKDVLAILDEKDAIQITPLAQKIAVDQGIDPNEVTGSGINGKVKKEDILSVVNKKEKQSGQTERIKLRGLRKVIAERMSRSSQTIPHVTLTTEVNMSTVMEIRQKLLPMIEEQTTFRLSYTEILMKAAAHTLKNHPYVNAALEKDEIVLNKSVHIGLAVAIDNGLIVPSIKNVNEKGLAELTTVCKQIVAKARNNELTSEELSGSTFTISNLGMYAIDGFTPIINPPETAILGVGRIVEKPVVIGKQIEIQPMMVLSLSFDHRVVDGAPAAAFLTELKEILEEPYGLLV